MSRKARVNFLWHFHQPYYAVPGQGPNKLPWVRLHAIRAYYDMGRMLEEHPEVGGTINFSGSLLRQLREYVEEGKRDTWWDLTLKPADRLTDSERLHILRHFFSLDWEASVAPLPRYQELLDRRGSNVDEIELGRFSSADLRDLQVLFNLAWFGFSAREERAVVQALLDKGSGFTESEKEALLEQQIEVMQLLVPMYRRLYRRGQIELSVSPMYHPIVPLVIDSDAMSRATPRLIRPPRFHAPDDAAVHIRRARQIARQFLGVDAAGMWPSEGSVSPEAVALFAEHDVEWIATDEAILAESRGQAYRREDDLYRPWRLGESDGPAIFFRDQTLSDRLGFVYAKNEPKIAVDDFLERVRAAAANSPGPEPVVSVILDGENPWVHYPNSGKSFLERLYTAIEAADDVETVLPSDYLADCAPPEALDMLHSGSWIHANYAIWIGDDEENRAWDQLARARHELVRADDRGDLTVDQRQAAWEALYVAEGSDWFWWYGDDFNSENDADFDRLFRDQLRFVYGVLGREIPEALDAPLIAHGRADIEFRPPQSLIHPRIDGSAEYFYEWSGAGTYVNYGAQGSMYENRRFIDRLRFGFDLEYFYLLVEPGTDLEARADEVEVRVRVQTKGGVHTITVAPRSAAAAEHQPPHGQPPGSVERVAYARCLELALPLEAFGLKPNDPMGFSIAIVDDRMEVERHPLERHFELVVPDATFDARNWLV